MTELKNFVQMLNNSKEAFTKERSGSDWIVRITDKKIAFYFSKDESFSFCTPYT